MSAQPIAPPDYVEMAKQSVCVVQSRNPYRDTPTEILLDTLEHHYDQTGGFLPDLVFEIANRLVRHEGLGIPEVEE